MIVSMRDDEHWKQDNDDRKDLAAGEIDRLLARYEPMIRARCIAQTSGSPVDGGDVAQDVLFRLFREYKNGKRYENVPYRVVVNMVVYWTLRDHWAGRRTDVELPPDWAEQADGRDDYAALDDRNAVTEMLADLPERQRQVSLLLFREGLSHEQVAVTLGITRNNVDQALHRALKQLREQLEPE